MQSKVGGRKDKKVREAVGLIQVKEKKSLKILVSKFGQLKILAYL
jgi:hypothetical protein